MGKLAIDEGAFSNYGEAAEYWLGILATEGCIGFRKNCAVPLIRYGSVDIEHVYKFREFLRSDHAVSLSDRMTHLGPCKVATFACTSREIGEFLICSGITPKKSLTLKVSERLARSPHFWRGTIDGDGTVGVYGKYKQPIVRLTSGSFQFIQQFAEFCASIGLRPKVADSCGGLSRAPHYNVAFGSEQAIQLLNILYAGATVWLDRKKLKVDEIFAQPVRQKYVRRMAVVAGVRVSASAVQ